MGRPSKYDPVKMAGIIDKYTEESQIPILKEVCYQNKWCDKYIHQIADRSEKLSESIKMLRMKKEVQLEKLGLFGVIDKTMAIFSLKQLGWKDRPDFDNEDLLEGLSNIANALNGGK